MASLFDNQDGLTIHAPVDLSRVPSVDPRVSTAVTYLNGGHMQLIRRAMAERFATIVERVKDPDSGKVTSHILRSKPAADAAIQLGLMETVSTYIMQRITRERSTLFSYGAKYEYDPASEALAVGLSELRDASRHNLTCQRMDWVACGVGSSALLIQQLGARLNYQQIDPDKIWVAFAETITDAQSGVVRPTDRLHLDDASAVVIQLVGSDGAGRCKYVAYFGASEEYPRGRMVAYTATMWHEIPSAVHGGDYLADDGEIANPLTLWRQMRNDATIPEYPVICWSGDGIISTTVLPVSLGLWDQSRELDVSLSRVLMAGLKGARGVFEIHREAGGSTTLPENADEGVVLTEQGISIKTHSGNAPSVDAALRVIDAIASHTAAAHGVPGYKVSISTQAVVPSGAALALMNQPALQERDRRINLNRSQALRMFRIETSLISAANGTPIAAGVTERWNPEPVPQIRDEMQERLIAEKDLALGVESVAGIAQELRGLDSLDAARNYVAEVAAEATKQPTATQPAPVAQAMTSATPRLFAGRRQ
jgi:hypothetical protein